MRLTIWRSFIESKKLFPKATVLWRLFPSILPTHRGEWGRTINQRYVRCTQGTIFSDETEKNDSILCFRAPKIPGIDTWFPYVFQCKLQFSSKVLGTLKNKYYPVAVLFEVRCQYWIFRTPLPPKITLIYHRKIGEIKVNTAMGVGKGRWRWRKLRPFLVETMKCPKTYDENCSKDARKMKFESFFQFRPTRNVCPLIALLCKFCCNMVIYIPIPWKWNVPPHFSYPHSSYSKAFTKAYMASNMLWSIVLSTLLVFSSCRTLCPKTFSAQNINEMTRPYELIEGVKKNEFHSNFPVYRRCTEQVATTGSTVARQHRQRRQPQQFIQVFPFLFIYNQVIMRIDLSPNDRRKFILYKLSRKSISAQV